MSVNESNMYRLQSLFIACGFLFSVGCVTVDTDKLPEDWPRVIRNPTSEQFAGVYKAIPAARTSSPESTVDHEDTLPFFLTGMKNYTASSCRIAESGGALILITKNDSVKFTKAGSNPGSSDGSLFIRNQTKRIIDPLAKGVDNNKIYLHLAEDGSLIGLREGYGAGFVLGIIPAFGSGKHWVLWERVEPSGRGDDDNPPN
jgi:hypothetical protein